jgi:hypothetical protein
MPLFMTPFPMDAIATFTKLNIQWPPPENTRVSVRISNYLIAAYFRLLLSRILCSLVTSEKLLNPVMCSLASAGELVVNCFLLRNNKVTSIIEKKPYANLFNSFRNPFK